ncbi:MAG: ABC transporter permease, partial [Actinomycetes bacterium]
MLKRLLSPFRNTTGLARWILITGLLITALFVLMAVFAPWIAPLDFNQRNFNGEK